MKYIIEIVSDGKTYIPRFKKIDRGVQAILRNFRGCNSGITDGRDYLIMPLKWAQVPVCRDKDWFRNSKVVRVCTYKLIHTQGTRSHKTNSIFFQNKESRIKSVTFLRTSNSNVY
jgi:hypothetical protein